MDFRIRNTSRDWDLELAQVETVQDQKLGLVPQQDMDWYRELRLKLVQQHQDLDQGLGLGLQTPGPPALQPQTTTPSGVVDKSGLGSGQGRPATHSPSPIPISRQRREPRMIASCQDIVAGVSFPCIRKFLYMDFQDYQFFEWDLSVWASFTVSPGSVSNTKRSNQALITHNRFEDNTEPVG